MLQPSRAHGCWTMYSKAYSNATQDGNAAGAHHLTVHPALSCYSPPSPSAASLTTRTKCPHTYKMRRHAASLTAASYFCSGTPAEPCSVPATLIAVHLQACLLSPPAFSSPALRHLYLTTGPRPDRIPPFCNEEALAVLKEELGRDPESVYQRISAEPVAAASLGQVWASHRARTGEVGGWPELCAAKATPH
eukprot:351237-Chlamydomonas_euryale.AAC.3